MEEILRDILKELQFQSKLLTSLVEGVDGRRFDQEKAKKEMLEKVSVLAGTMEGSPFGPILSQVVKTIGGK